VLVIHQLCELALDVNNYQTAVMYLEHSFVFSAD